MGRVLGFVPGWLIVLIVIAILAWILNAAGIIHIHFTLGGSVNF